MNSITGYSRNRNIVIFLTYIFVAFLTFKYLVSINISGFSIRVPHIVFSFVFVYIFFYLVFKEHRIILKELLFFLFLIVFISVLNGSIFSPYFFYLIFIIIANIAIFNIFYIYKISPIKIAKIVIVASMFHLFLSLFTIKREWYGGLQIKSFSDYNTFFALQLSLIIPFIYYFNKKIRVLLYLIYVPILILAGSRGALLSLLIAYFVISKNKITFSLKLIALLILSSMIIFIFSPESLTFLLSKVPILSSLFGLHYNNVSDINRYIYIIATIEYLPHIWILFIGNGIKFNKYIIENINFYVPNVELNLHATVHNLFLEIYSDYGILILLYLLFILLRIFFILGRNLKRKYKTVAPIFASFISFIFNYNFEPNYVHYTFWFFLCYYVYSAYYVKRGDNDYNYYTNL